MKKIFMVLVCILAVEARFQRHEPGGVISISYSPYRMILIGETDRRGEERTVIGERSDGERETLATWDFDLNRWNTEHGQLWEDVRVVPICDGEKK